MPIHLSVFVGSNYFGITIVGPAHRVELTGDFLKNVHANTNHVSITDKPEFGSMINKIRVSS